MAKGSQPPRAKSRSLGAALKYFLDRRVLVMLGLGFSAGLPYMLVFDTLSAWLREANLSLEVIGFFSLATIASSFKFLWAPLIDRTTVPLLTPRLGHRRSWMIVAQLAIVLGLWLIAGSNPANNLGLVALFAVLTGFASATQDIVVDAWRIEAAEQERQGAMAAAYQWGYRIAQIVAGAIALLLAQYYGWAISYTVMAALMAIGIVSVLFAPAEHAHAIRHVPMDGIAHRPWWERAEWLIRLAIVVLGALFLGTGLSGKADVIGIVAKPMVGAAGMGELAGWLASNPLGLLLQLGFIGVGFAIVALAALPVPGIKTRPGAFLFHALGDPLRDFFARQKGSASLILALICVYRLSESVLNIMNPFYLDLGFSLADIAEVRKLFGVVATMIGVAAGGLAVAQFGLVRSLVIGAFAQPVSHAGFIWLATRGHHIGALFTAIGLDNVASGFAGTCLIAYMSSLTSEGFTATQYALFSSLYSLPGKIIASQSGRLVEASARNIDAGGLFGVLKGLFGSLPGESYASGAAKLGVSAAALGGGYLVFFFYSGLIGVLGILLAILIGRRKNATQDNQAFEPAPQRTG